MFKYKLGLVKTKDKNSIANIYPINTLNKNSEEQEIASKYLYEFFTNKPYIKNIEGIKIEDKDFSKSIRYELELELETSKFELLLNDINMINDKGLCELEEYFEFLNKNKPTNHHDTSSNNQEEKFTQDMKEKIFKVQQLTNLNKTSSLITNKDSNFCGNHQASFNIFSDENIDKTVDEITNYLIKQEYILYVCTLASSIVNNLHHINIVVEKEDDILQLQKYFDTIQNNNKNYKI